MTSLFRVTQELFLVEGSLSFGDLWLRHGLSFLLREQDFVSWVTTVWYRLFESYSRGLPSYILYLY